MKYVSAGHCNRQGSTYDSGAVGVNGRKEADETVKVRDKVIWFLQQKGFSVVRDYDTESLSQYLTRIQTGSGSMVCEFHFNAGPPTATGVETLVQVDYDKADYACAKEMSAVTSNLLGLSLRGKDGVKTEADSQHKRLGLMREQGIVVLVEVCFISNARDMKLYDEKFDALCEAYADIIIKYDNLIN